MAGAGLVLTLLMAVCGVLPRLALIVSTAFYFLYFGQIGPLSYVMRKVYLIPQIFLLLAVAPGISQNMHSEAPKWPLLVIEAMLAQMYFTAGYCKLRAGGIAWGSWTTLESILLQHHLVYDIPLSCQLAGNRRICAAMALGALIFELTFWLILPAPSLALFYAAAGIMLHLMARLLMRIDYLTYHAPLYLVFAVGPLARLLAHA
jgi:hypothetical protein